MVSSSARMRPRWCCPGDARPGAACDEFVAGADSEVSVAQCGVRGHHHGGAHG